MSNDESSQNPKPESNKEVESSFLKGDLETTVTHYWNKYNRAIITGIAAVFFAYVGIEGISWFKARQVDKLQETYKIAIDDGLELEFAQKNPKEPLSGTVFLGEADSHFSSADYPKAIEYYKKAQNSLKNGPLLYRARMGQAMATYLSGDSQVGLKELEALMNDKNLLGVTRAEAAYQLAIIYVDKNDLKKADNYITAITRIDNAGFWLEKASLLKRTTAGLAEK